MGGSEYVVASESVALEALGFDVLRDAPGRRSSSTRRAIPRAPMRGEPDPRALHFRVRSIWRDPTS
jgi:hypothetical protein